MAVEPRSVRALMYEFFEYYPDYLFCKTLAENVENNVTDYSHAINILSRKALAAQQNRTEIEDKMNQRSVEIAGRRVRIREMSLREIMKQEDEILRQILNFYFKYPYAHRRTLKSRFLPRWIRTFFLSVLVGHARQRKIDLDYPAYFEMLRML